MQSSTGGGSRPRPAGDDGRPFDPRFPGLLASHSGLRESGEVEITEAQIAAVVGGMVEQARREGLPLRVGVGRDDRARSGPMAGAAIEAAIAAGAQVSDVGATCTPGSRLTAIRHRLGAMLMVTGSHLAEELNGLKVSLGPTHRPVDIRRLPDPPGPQPGGGRNEPVDAAGEHVDAIAGSVDTGAIAVAGLQAGVRGGAGNAADRLLARLGLDGAGDPDVVFELDADGDRLRLVDRAAGPLDSELSLPLTALATGARTAVRSADTSRMLDRLLGDEAVYEVPPGELHLGIELERRGADLAGEGNGGIIVPGVGPGRDGLAAAAQIVELMASEQQSVSALAARIPTLYRRRGSVPAADGPALEASLHRCSTLAGAHVEGPMVRIERTAAWALVRRSATEPILKLTVEAGRPGDADALLTELTEAIGG